MFGGIKSVALPQQLKLTSFSTDAVRSDENLLSWEVKVIHSWLQ